MSPDPVPQGLLPMRLQTFHSATPRSSSRPGLPFRPARREENGTYRDVLRYRKYKRSYNNPHPQIPQPTFFHELFKKDLRIVYIILIIHHQPEFRTHHRIFDMDDRRHNVVMGRIAVLRLFCLYINLGFNCHSGSQSSKIRNEEKYFYQRF